jgi:hypothetical protein
MGRGPVPGSLLLRPAELIPRGPRLFYDGIRCPWARSRARSRCRRTHTFTGTGSGRGSAVQLLGRQDEFDEGADDAVDQRLCAGSPRRGEAVHIAHMVEDRGALGGGTFRHAVETGFLPWRELARSFGNVQGHRQGGAAELVGTRSARARVGTCWSTAIAHRELVDVQAQAVGVESLVVQQALPSWRPGQQSWVRCVCRNPSRQRPGSRWLRRKQAAQEWLKGRRLPEHGDPVHHARERARAPAT